MNENILRDSISNFKILDNYVLGATTPGTYTIFSPMQKEQGPRLLDQYFGFAYMGKGGNIRSFILKNGIKTDLTPPGFLNPAGNYWEYFLKNITSAVDSYAASDEWQVD